MSAKEFSDLERDPPARVGSMPRALPPELRAYRRTPVFSHESVPPGLLRDHTTKTGTWALIHVLNGRLRYQVPAWGTDVVLTPEQQGVVAPQVVHSVQPLGEVQFFVEFWSTPDR